MDDDVTGEMRRIRRRLEDLARDVERARRANGGLVIALVGLVGGMSLPWMLAFEPYRAEGADLSGGVTEWFDGWLMLAESVQHMGEGGWAIVIATVGPMVLAALVAVLLTRPGRSLARAVQVVGWVGTVGLGLTWVVSWFGADLRGGAGIPVTALAALAAAVSARSVRDLTLSAAPAPTAASLLSAGAVRATPAPPPEEPHA